jgi:hypothetical protein
MAPPFFDFYTYLYAMSTSKTIIKRTGRRRGTVPLKKVRQAVAAAFALHGIKRSTDSTAKVKAAKKRS